MKNIWIYVLLLVSLAACAGASSGHEGCSVDGELCIGMQLEEPILFGDSNTITITVSSNIDIGKLKIYLYSYPQVLIEDMNDWVNHGVNWVIDIEANQPQTFTRNVLLPEKDGFYHIITSANTTQFRTIYSLSTPTRNGISGSIIRGPRSRSPRVPYQRRIQSCLKPCAPCPPGRPILPLPLIRRAQAPPPLIFIPLHPRLPGMHLEKNLIHEGEPMHH